MDIITGGNPEDGGDAIWTNLADLLQAYKLNVPLDLESMTLPPSNSWRLQGATISSNPSLASRSHSAWQ